MAEYIDRNYIGKSYIDLCKALSQKSKICPGANEPTVKDVFALVMHAPAADVVEVRHGRWERHPQSNEDDPVYTCSLCKLNVSGFEKRWIKYCPNCGALMDRKEDKDGQDPIKRSASDH